MTISKQSAKIKKVKSLFTLKNKVMKETSEK